MAKAHMDLFLPGQVVKANKDYSNAPNSMQER